jgi:hypothetical protein
MDDARVSRLQRNSDISKTRNASFVAGRRSQYGLQQNKSRPKAALRKHRFDQAKRSCGRAQRTRGVAKKVMALPTRAERQWIDFKTN